MKSRFSLLFVCVFAAIVCGQALAQKSTHDPTWWDKYQFLLNNGPASLSLTPPLGGPLGRNDDVSNQFLPHSHTHITLTPNQPKMLAAGSSEIFRDRMPGYFSSDGGKTWGGIDLPLPE